MLVIDRLNLEPASARVISEFRRASTPTRPPPPCRSKFSAQRMRAAPGAASVTDSQSFRRARIPRRMNPLVALLALGGANIAGLWAVLALLRALADGSEPVTVVKLQVGLLTDPSKVQQHLSELCCMMKVRRCTDGCRQQGPC